MMSSLMLLGVVIVILCLIYLYMRRSKYDKSLISVPLVPGSLPFFGHIASFSNGKPHHTLYKWAKKYGGIFRFQVLGEDIIVLNDVNLIRQAFLGTAFAGRPRLFRIDYGFHFSHDVIFGNFSPKWEYMKKLIVFNLRKYGPGKLETEEIIEEEIQDLMHSFSSQNGRAFDPCLIVTTCVVNALTASIIGKRFNYNSEEMKSYREATRLFSEACSVVTGMELDLMPWLRFLPSDNFRKLTKARQLLDKWVDNELKNTKLRCSQEATCILEEFLLSQKKDQDEFSLNDQDVRNLFIDLLISGTFTTSIAVNTFCLYMSTNQEIQDKLRKQVRASLNDSYSVLKRRQEIPLLEAIILEILRLISHVPLSLPHFTLEDTRLAGFDIPKSTQVLFNLWYVHHDEELWDNPWEFNPYRFLDEEGQLKAATDSCRKNLMPFSGGRRACPGETLAKDRVFLISAHIIQHFQLCLDPDDESRPSVDPRDFQLGLILEPDSYKIIAKSLK